MNQTGEFFAGFEKGHFKWSPFIQDAKPLEYIEQFETIRKFEPQMDLVYDYV